ncbi:hypothetical protein IW261DRAFT_1594292 [Armillaria novae-zelandiae]|uniref:Uncharacterized protein n=1 Tax=Armillaria novae-zelandiae TaxID=153914 RepID=A0AA39U981_9AGAR|nr:hypothetical protein IW261DRAFT_1594292 [Armillaria novae-zelandiae]
MVFVGKSSDSIVKQENNTSCREGGRLFLCKRRTALHVQIYGLDLTLMVLRALRQNSDIRVLICSEFEFKFELGIDRIYYCGVKPFINTVIASVEQSCLADIQQLYINVGTGNPRQILGAERFRMAIAIYYSILTEPVPVVIHSTSSYGVVDHAALQNAAYPKFIKVGGEEYVPARDPQRFLYSFIVENRSRNGVRCVEPSRIVIGSKWEPSI